MPEIWLGLLPTLPELPEILPGLPETLPGLPEISVLKGFELKPECWDGRMDGWNISDHLDFLITWQ